MGKLLRAFGLGISLVHSPLCENSIRIEKKMQVAPIEAGRDNTPITLPARTPLTFEQACRTVGLKLKQARRYMADPDFKNFDGVLAGYRASLAPGNIAVARSIRDDESVEPKARLKACEYLDGPRPLATGPVVNIALAKTQSAFRCGGIRKRL